MAEDLFTKINALDSLQFIAADSEDELLKEIRKIHLPVSIKTIYARNGKTICWFFTDAKIVKKTRKKRTK